MSRVTVELRDGRRLEYTDETPEAIIEDLIARGVGRAEIKNTIHHIERHAIRVHLEGLAALNARSRREP